MGFYNKHILPKLVDRACQIGSAMKQREKIVPLAHGRVLEIGVGSGLNLPFYNKETVKHLTAIDPSAEMWRRNKIDLSNLHFDVDFVMAFAEEIPVESNTFDTVILTYTLCTIPNPEEAFHEIRRVMKPNAQLLFCEHGKAPDALVQKWQNRINPIWKRLGGGCHLNKDIPTLIEENGFSIRNLNQMYINGWKPASYNFLGVAEQK